MKRRHSFDFENFDALCDDVLKESDWQIEEAKLTLSGLDKFMSARTPISPEGNIIDLPEL